jgi:hypothetical protein
MVSVAGVLCCRAARVIPQIVAAFPATRQHCDNTAKSITRDQMKKKKEKNETAPAPACGVQ